MHVFKRFAIAAGIALGSSVLYSTATLAQTTTGTINIGGDVQTTLNIDITETGTPAALNLGGQGTDNAETIVQVADLVLRTNNGGGMSLTITSGDMTFGGSTTPLPYKVVTTADGVAAGSGDFTTASGTDHVETYNQQGGGGTELGADGTLARDLAISYDPPQNLDPGAYSGTITLTVLDL